MKRVINIDLDYDLDQLKAEGMANVPSNPEITRNIIENTYGNNHERMTVSLARIWRRVVKKIEKQMAVKSSIVVLSDDDFKSVMEEINECSYPQAQAFVVPVLMDELERVRDLSKEESKAALASVEEASQVNKVLEMSQ